MISAKSGRILNEFEIVNEYGKIEKFKNKLNQGEDVWMYYNKHGTLIKVELKSLTIINQQILKK